MFSISWLVFLIDLKDHISGTNLNDKYENKGLHS